MSRPAVLAAVAVLCALAAVGCSSPADDIDDACATVRQVAEAVPATAGPDGATEIVPRQDQQLAAARTAAEGLRAAGADANLQSRWAGMIDALQQSRDAWVNSASPNRARGSDMVIALGLSAKSEGVDTAKADLAATARTAGHAGCGEIPWKY